MSLELSHSAPTASEAVAPQEDVLADNAESSGSEPLWRSAAIDYSNEPARYNDDPKPMADEKWDENTTVPEEKNQTVYWADPETDKPDAAESTTTAFNALETNDTSTDQSAIEESSDQPDLTTNSNNHTVDDAQFTNTTETVFDSTTATITSTERETSTCKYWSTKAPLCTAYGAGMA